MVKLMRLQGAVLVLSDSGQYRYMYSLHYAGNYLSYHITHLPSRLSQIIKLIRQPSDTIVEVKTEKYVLYFF